MVTREELLERDADLTTAALRPTIRRRKKPRNWLVGRRLLAILGLAGAVVFAVGLLWGNATKDEVAAPTTTAVAVTTTTVAATTTSSEPTTTTVPPFPAQLPDRVVAVSIAGELVTIDAASGAQIQVLDTVAAQPSDLDAVEIGRVDSRSLRLLRRSGGAVPGRDPTGPDRRWRAGDHRSRCITSVEPERLDRGDGRPAGPVEGDHHRPFQR